MSCDDVIPYSSENGTCRGRRGRSPIHLLPVGRARLRRGRGHNARIPAHGIIRVHWEHKDATWTHTVCGMLWFKLSCTDEPWECLMTCIWPTYEAESSRSRCPTLNATRCEIYLYDWEKESVKQPMPRSQMWPHFLRTRNWSRHQNS